MRSLRPAPPSLRVDVGTRAADVPVDVAADEVAGHHPEAASAVLGIDDRGSAVAAMARGLRRVSSQSRERHRRRSIGIGGGGGTSIITAGMRALPLGLPKIMVSTLASGDVAPYVDVSDIVMMPSVTDMAGLNRLSAASCCTMPRRRSPAWRRSPGAASRRQAVDRPHHVRRHHALRDGRSPSASRDDYDCMVFHATGTGGRAMEKLADSGLLAGVIDITTTEVCDLLFGGVLPATADRFGAIARTRLPYVGSVGALDMVNFWAPRDRARAAIAAACSTSTIPTSR